MRRRCFAFYHQTLRVCYQVALIDPRLLLGLVGPGWKNFARRETSPRSCRANSSCGCRPTSEPKSFVQLRRKEIFDGGRGDKYAFSFRTSPGVQSDNFWKTLGWKMIAFDGSDRMFILSELQDQYQSNIPRLDFSSMRIEGIVYDVVHSSQSFQDLSVLSLCD